MIICRLPRSTHCLARIDMTSGRAAAALRPEAVEATEAIAGPLMALEAYEPATVDFTAQLQTFVHDH